VIYIQLYNSILSWPSRWSCSCCAAESCPCCCRSALA